MHEDWNSIIRQLEAIQKTCDPGDLTILDIAATIQTIQAEALGGNQGHAQFFLRNPVEKDQAFARLHEMISKFIPS
jgi:hypothetical protein